MMLNDNINRKIYTPTVTGCAGVRTIKNLILTAFMPVGKTLYVYGGGWNVTDSGGSRGSVTIGLPSEWAEFFDSHDELYEYKSGADGGMYYPKNGRNEYGYAGADCSGYLGWVLYNVINTKNGGESLVFPSTNIADILDKRYGFGKRYAIMPKKLCAGDICSIKGHVWLCVGQCSDGSIVILHSTPSESRVGKKGGGVQLSSVGGMDSKAYRLARLYMEKFYPQWCERYEAVDKPYSVYTDFSYSGTGLFRWTLSDEGGVMEDKEGYTKMTAEEILRNVFGE